MPAAVDLRDATFGYPGRPHIIRGAHLRVERGRTAAVIGPSGCGKTTLLKGILGLLPPAGGHMEVLGTAFPETPERGSLGYIPQRLGLLSHATATRNAVLGGLHAVPAWRTLFGVPAPDVVQRARRALASVGMEDHADERVRNLSGGQQRRVAVARALVQRPALLLADEFLGELDPDTSRLVIATVKELQRETGMSVILVEHDLDQAFDLADDVYLLKDGKLRHRTAPPAEPEAAVAR